MHTHECPLCRKEKPNAGFSLLSISRKDHSHTVGICAECADALKYALAAPLRDGPVVLLDWMPKEARQAIMSPHGIALTRLAKFFAGELYNVFEMEKISVRCREAAHHEKLPAAQIQPLLDLATLAESLGM